MLDEKKFIELYQRHKDSGLTVRDFCSNELIAPSTYYYWKKKLRSNKRLPDFIPILVNSTPAKQRRLPGQPFSVSPGQQENNPDFELEFPNGTVVRMKRGFDFSILRELIHLYD
jgi:hypothetical protein